MKISLNDLLSKKESDTFNNNLFYEYYVKVKVFWYSDNQIDKV